MVIINQLRNNIVNWDNVTRIYLYAESITDTNRTCIMADLISGGDGLDCCVVLGTYGTEGQAEFILNDLATRVSGAGSHIYRMPEE